MKPLLKKTFLNFPEGATVEVDVAIVVVVAIPAVVDVVEVEVSAAKADLLVCQNIVLSIQ